MFVVAFLSVQTTSASDNSTQSITISPGRTSLSVDPGKTIQKSFDVINGGRTDYIVKLSVEPYSVRGLDYEPQFTSPSKNDATSWVTLEVTKENIPAQDVSTFFYSITVPEDAKPGGYFAVIFAAAEQKADTSTLTPKGRVGNVLYITVTGPSTLSGTLNNTSPPRLVIDPNITTELILSNDGQIHFLSDTVVTIRSITGKILHESSSQSMILPGKDRRVQHSWSPTVPIGIYSLDRSATVGKASQQLSRFWIVHMHPWILPGFLILFILGELLLHVIKKRRPSTSGKAQITTNTKEKSV